MDHLLATSFSQGVCVGFFFGPDFRSMSGGRVGASVCVSVYQEAEVLGHWM